MKAEAIEAVFRHSADSQVAHGCLHVRPRVENAHRETQSQALTHELVHLFYGLNTRHLSSIVHYPRTAFDPGQRTPLMAAWIHGARRS